MNIMGLQKTIWCKEKKMKHNETVRIFHGIYSMPHNGIYSLSGKASCRKFSWSAEAARLGVELIVLLWNLTGAAAALPVRFQNDRTTLSLYLVSRFHDIWVRQAVLHVLYLWEMLCIRTYKYVPVMTRRYGYKYVISIYQFTRKF